MAKKVASAYFLCSMHRVHDLQRAKDIRAKGSGQYLRTQVRPVACTRVPANNLLRVHHCLLVVPGTRYCSCTCWTCWVGWPGKDGFTYRYATGIRVPGTRYQVPGNLLVPGTRYRTPYVHDCCKFSGTVNHHSFRIVWSWNWKVLVGVIISKQYHTIVNHHTVVLGLYDRETEKRYR